MAPLLLSLLVAISFQVAAATTQYTNNTAAHANTTTYAHSSLASPLITGVSYSWWRAYTAVTVGTVMVVVDEGANRTTTTTRTRDKYTANSTLDAHIRTDINAAGTVTAVTTDILGRNISLTYPTPLEQYDSEILWGGIFPITTSDPPYCGYSITSSPTPPHTPFPSPTGTLDPDDPNGLLYKLQRAAWMDYMVGPTNNTWITPLWPDYTFSLAYEPCTYSAVDNAPIANINGEFAVTQVAYLLATSTATVTAANTAKSSAVRSSSLPLIAAQTASNVVPPNTAATSSLSAPHSAATTVRAEGDQLRSSAVDSPDASPNTVMAQSTFSGTAALYTAAGSTIAVAPSAVTQSYDAGSSEMAPSSASEDLDVLLSLLPSIATAVSHASANAASAGQEPASTPGQSPNAPAAPTHQQSFVSQAYFSPSETASTLLSSGDSGSLPPIVVGDSTVSPSSSVYIISGQTLVAGSSITLGSGSSTTLLALHTEPSAIVLQVGTAYSTLQTHADGVAATRTSAGLPKFVIGGSTIAPSASAYIIAGQTLVPGSSILLGPGGSTTFVALQTVPSATVLHIGTSISTLQVGDSIPTLQGGSAPIAEQASVGAPPLVIGGSTITANSASQYIVSGQTLTPGSSITLGSGISTTVVALETSGSEILLVIGTSTSILQSAPSLTGVPPVFTIGSSIIRPNSASDYIIGSQTLVSGGSAITISGSRISLAPGATELIVGTSSEALVASETEGLAGYIWGGIDNTPTTSSASTDVRSTSLRNGSQSTASSWETIGGATATPGTNPKSQSSAQLSGDCRLRREWLLLLLMLTFIVACDL